MRGWDGCGPFKTICISMRIFITEQRKLYRFFHYQIIFKCLLNDIKFYKTGSDDDSDSDSYEDIESENEGDSDSEKPTVSQPKKATLDLKVNYVCHLCCIF